MTTTTATRRDIAQEITNRVINALEQNQKLKWRKTWQTGYGIARNYATKRPYSGINFMTLNFFAPYEIPYYLGFSQIQELGGKIRKGAKAEQVVFFNRQYKADGKSITAGEYIERRNNNPKDPNITAFAYLKYYNVFNVADVEGVALNLPKMVMNENEKIKRCEDILQKMPTPPKFVSENQNRCFYNRVQDLVNMPDIKYFDTSDAYYHTFFHELTHATGHPKRLNRDLGAKFGDKNYAFEELVAELGAAYLAERTGILQVAEFENTAAYIQSWLKALRNDKTFIFKAASEAQKAYNFITNGSSQEDEEM